MSNSGGGGGKFAWETSKSEASSAAQRDEWPATRAEPAPKEAIDEWQATRVLPRAGAQEWQPTRAQSNSTARADDKWQPPGPARGTPQPSDPPDATPCPATK